MSAREKLRQRLQALAGKTVERGCTEAEALAAAEKLAQLMREHGVSEAELTMDRQSSQSKSKGHAIRAQLWPVIARCTSTSAITVTRGDNTSVEFIGREPGPQIAVYLRDVCERALDTGIRDFKGRRFYRARKNARTRRQAVAEFGQGFVNRMRHRLLDIFGPQIDRQAIAAADRALAEIYPDTTTVQPKTAALEFGQARSAGWQAAGDVHLGHGVGARTSPKLIGGET